MPTVFDNGQSWQIGTDDGQSHSVFKGALSPEQNQKMSTMAATNVTPMPVQNTPIAPPMAQPAMLPIEQQNTQNMGLNLNAPPPAMPVTLPQPQMPAPMPEMPQGDTAFAVKPAQSAGTSIQETTTGLTPQGQTEVKKIGNEMAVTEKEVKASLDAQAQADQKVQEEIFRTAENNMKLVDQFKQGEALRQQELDQQRADYEKARETANNFEFQDFWASRNIGQKILAGLGMALGAYAQAKGGGQNTALAIVDNAIKEHANTQRAQYEKMSKNVDLKGNVYQMAMKQTGDARLAELTAMDAGYKQAEMKLNGFIQAAKSEQQKRDGLQMLAGLQAKRADIAAQAAGRQSVIVENKLAPSQVVPVDPKTGKEIPVPKFSNVNDYFNAKKSSSEIVKWEEAKGYADEIQRMRENGRLDNAIVSKYIAGKGGLNQGSYSEKMQEMIAKGGMKNWTADKFERWLSGKPPQEFVNALVEDAILSEQAAYKAAYPILRAFDMGGQAVGIPATLAKKPPQESTKDKAKSLGLTTVGVKK